MFIYVHNKGTSGLLAGREDLAVALSKSDTDAVLLAPTSQNHLIVIVQELAGDTLLQLNVFGTAPGELKQGAK